MLSSWIPLAGLSAALGYLLLENGGVRLADLLPCLIALALVSLLYWTTVRQCARAPSHLFQAALIAAPLIVAVQLIPPGSLARSATLESLLVLLGCILVFLLVRDIASQPARSPWAPVAPLVAFGALEALLGVAQSSVLPPDIGAHGTYLNRNHFAGLLEMLMPFPLAWGLSAVRDSRRAAKACVLFGVAALMLAAVVDSLSRMGFAASLAGLAVYAFIRHRRAALPILVSASAAFFLLPSSTLIGRFAELHAHDASAETRAQIWRDTLPLIRDYPLLGCGLGAYGTAIARYRTLAPPNDAGYAHNDYLQLLAEGGAAGFMAIMLGAAAAVAAAWKCARRDGAFLPAACLASMAAIAIHSGFDFNLHIPANALTLAWIAGIAAACR